LEDLDAGVEVNSPWKTIRENTKISAIESLGYFETKKHKPCFDKDAQYYQITENKLNCSGYEIQVK
jgi:hypothetical protein